MYFDRNISEIKDGKKKVRAIICLVYQTVNSILEKLSSSTRECLSRCQILNFEKLLLFFQLRLPGENNKYSKFDTLNRWANQDIKLGFFGFPAHCTVRKIKTIIFTCLFYECNDILYFDSR